MRAKPPCVAIRRVWRARNSAPICGASLEPVSGPVKDAVQSAAREEVRLALQSYTKDRRIAEFDVTENVINRLIGWAKTIGILFGVVLVVAGWFGFKSFSDQVQ